MGEEVEADNVRDFGELCNDHKFIGTVSGFEESLLSIEKSLNDAVEASKGYDSLDVQEMVKLDSYMAYSINSLYWMYVKLQGIDPNEHGVKNELSRVRESILREKKIIDRNTIRPVLDKAAAGRFIKHGLHIRNMDEDPVVETQQEEKQ